MAPSAEKTQPAEEEAEQTLERVRASRHNTGKADQESSIYGNKVLAKDNLARSHSRSESSLGPDVTFQSSTDEQTAMRLLLALFNEESRDIEAALKSSKPTNMKYYTRPTLLPGEDLQDEMLSMSEEELRDLAAVMFVNKQIMLQACSIAHYELFCRTDSIEDLDEAICAAEEALSLSTTSKLRFQCCLKNLVSLLAERFRILGELKDVQAAIIRAKELITMTPTFHVDRTARWVDSVRLELAELAHPASTTEDDILMERLLEDLQIFLKHSSEDVEQMIEDVEEAESFLEDGTSKEALALSQASLGELTASRVVFVAMELVIAGLESKKLPMLEIVIKICQKAIERWPLIGDIWVAYHIATYTRLQLSGYIDNVDMIIEDIEIFLNEVGPGFEAEDLYHTILAGYYYHRYCQEESSNLVDLNATIYHSRTAARMGPFDLCNNLQILSKSLMRRAMHSEKLPSTPADASSKDLKAAWTASLRALEVGLKEITQKRGITQSRQALRFVDRATAHFPITTLDPTEGLILLICRSELYLQGVEIGDSKFMTAYTQLSKQAESSTKKWPASETMNLLGHLPDTDSLDSLCAVINMIDGVIDTGKDKTPNLHNNIIVLLMSSHWHLLRGVKYGEALFPDDLNLAIERAQETEGLAPRSHQLRPPALSQLAMCLNVRGIKSQNIKDLDDCVMLLDEALEKSEVQESAGYISDLVYALIDRAKIEYSEECVKRAIALANKYVDNTETNAHLKFDTATMMMKGLLPFQRHQGLGLLFDKVVASAPHASMRALSQWDQQSRLKKRPPSGTWLCAMALEIGKSPCEALLTLERSRGVISGLKFETRRDLAAIMEANIDLGRQFERIASELDSSDPQQSLEQMKDASSTSSPDTEPTSALLRRYFLLEELDETVKAIRKKVPGFSNFLKPLEADDLIAAAQKDPVVIINLDFRCDTFILRRGNVRHLSLPNVQPAKAVQIFLDVFQDMRRFPSNYTPATRRRFFFLMLAWLWTVMVNPILKELGFRETPSTGSWPRVVWIPTGILSQLPLHAAGYHVKGSTITAIDRVISSYSLSVKALIFTRNNFASRKMEKQSQSVLLASMAKTPGQDDLPFADQEVTKLNDIFRDTLPTKALNSPTKQDILTRLKDCQVFHFAGHGISHAVDPSKSSLLLHDWRTDPLTVEDLFKLKLHETLPWLAYLSACSTGENQDSKLLDESIHAISAFQLAGFQHVVGTLWEVIDKHSLDLALSFYTQLKDVVGKEETVASALHHAVRQLREELRGVQVTSTDEESPLSWFSTNFDEYETAWIENHCDRLTIYTTVDLVQQIVDSFCSQTGSGSIQGVFGSNHLGFFDEAHRTVSEKNRTIFVIDDDDKEEESASLEWFLDTDPLVWAAYIHVGM